MTPTATSALPVNLGDGPFAVTTAGLVKRYGPSTALNGVDLQLPEHAVYVLVGPNGAGKSTLLRTLMGLARRHAGEVNVLGADPALEGGDVRAHIGYVPEDHRFGYSWLTVGRLLQHHAVYYPSWDSAYALRLMEMYEVDTDKKCHPLQGRKPAGATHPGARASASAPSSGRANRRSGSRGPRRDVEHPQRALRGLPDHGADFDPQGLRSGALG